MPEVDRAWTEREILQGCRARDPDAAAALIRAHQPALGRIVGRLVGRRAVTEEIVQEAFFRVFRSIDRIDPDQGLRPWLYRTAVNLARDHLRRGKHPFEQADLLTPSVRASDASDPEEHAASREEHGAIERALLLLSRRQREVVLLHYVEGLPFTEIASILRMPAPAVKMRAVRARRRLRLLLSRDFS